MFKNGEETLTYLVTDNCIMCKFSDCVEVCPVDCFYEGENMLVIDPSECIDCGVCEPECPAEAIVNKSDLSEDEAEKWDAINREYSGQWPNITTNKLPLEDADKFNGEQGKFEKYFSPEPGKED